MVRARIEFFLTGEGLALTGDIFSDHEHSDYSYSDDEDSEESDSESEDEVEGGTSLVTKINSLGLITIYVDVTRGLD